MVDKKLIDEAIKTLEKAKKESYSARELRGGNKMLNRLDRIQDRDLNRRISLTQDSLKDKTIFDSFLINEDDQGEDEDVLKMFGIKKKKKVQMRRTQNNRGGFWQR